MAWFPYMGVHFFRLECNTATSVMVYYTLPGVRILNSSRFPMKPGQSFAEGQGEQELRGLHLISRYLRGILCMVLVCHLNVEGSIPIPAMIFLHGFYQCSSFSLDRDREREKINQWTNLFPFQIEKKEQFKDGVKSIKTSLSKKKIWMLLSSTF
jgi:hypothetical protein